MATVGLMHPGEMGSSIGAAARAGGNEVLWCSSDRSRATHERAEADGLTAVTDLGELAERSEFLLSVCPPAAASDVATQAVEAGFSGVFVDANAVAPETSRRIADRLPGSVDGYVDGGIVGPPARMADLTILYLSGPRAEDVAGLFAGSLLDVHLVSRRVGDASALKMAFSGWTKGSAALLLAVRAFADAEGVTEGLLHAWARFSPDLAQRVKGTARGTSPKAWRFAPEMREIAASLSAAGLPDGFHGSAAEIYERLAEFKDAGADLDQVVRALLSEKDA